MLCSAVEPLYSHDGPMMYSFCDSVLSGPFLPTTVSFSGREAFVVLLFVSPFCFVLGPAGACALKGYSIEI